MSSGTFSPSFPSPSSPLHILAPKETFLSSIFLLPVSVNSSLCKPGYWMWALGCPTWCFAHGGSSEDVPLASEVTVWEHSSKICFQSEVFQVRTVLLSQWLVTLVLSPKTAFPNHATYTSMVKEAKL